MRLPPRLALGAALLLPPVSGHAQRVTAQTAQSIQSQLQSWIAGLLGPGAEAAKLTPTVVPEGDHYRLTLPIPGLVNEATATAKVRPLDHGRWGLDALQLPSSMYYNAHLPGPGGKPSSTAVRITLGSQHWNGVIDPALKSRSELTADVHDVQVHSVGPLERQDQRIKEDSLTASLQPGQNGRLDFQQSGTVTGWSTTATIQGKPAMSFGAERVSTTGRIVGLDRNQVSALASAVAELIRTLPPEIATDGPKPPLDPAARAALRQIVESLRGIFTSFQAEETFDGLHVALSGKGEATVHHARFGIGGSAPKGLLHTWIDLSVDGMTVPGVPPQYAGLVPQNLTLRPSVAGVPADIVMKLLLDATRPNANLALLRAEAQTLMNTPGATVALEKIGFNIGPTVVSGNGHLTVTGSNQYQGEAHLTATGFDALMKEAHENPTLQTAMPALIMLRGLAKPEGDRLVWNVVAAGGAVTVNGIELIKPQTPQATPPGAEHSIHP